MLKLYNSCNKILLNTVYTFLNSLLFLVKKSFSLVSKSLALFITKVVKKSYYMYKKCFENKLEILSASEGVGDKKFFCTRKKFFLSANE